MLWGAGLLGAMPVDLPLLRRIVLARSLQSERGSDSALKREKTYRYCCIEVVLIDRIHAPNHDLQYQIKRQLLAIEGCHGRIGSQGE